MPPRHAESTTGEIDAAEPADAAAPASSTPAAGEAPDAAADPAISAAGPSRSAANPEANRRCESMPRNRMRPSCSRQPNCARSAHAPTPEPEEPDRAKMHHPRKPRTGHEDVNVPRIPKVSESSPTGCGLATKGAQHLVWRYAMTQPEAAA